MAAVERGETVTICRNGTAVIDCVPAKPTGPFPFGAWADLVSEQPALGSLDHMVTPTDEADLDAMDL